MPITIRVFAVPSLLVPILIFRGTLDDDTPASRENLRETLVRLLPIARRSGTDRLVLDLRLIDHVTFPGFALLAAIKGIWEKEGGVVTVCGPGHRLASVLAVCTIQRMFSCHEVLSEAALSGLACEYQDAA